MRWVMKSRFLAGFGMLALILGGAFLLTAKAQTTDEGAGPSEQPSAPMEVGQAQQPPAPPSADQQPPKAQPGGPSGEAAAKTDLGVARISLIHGEVSTQRGDSGDWSAATMNQPVMGGDKISTGDNARAELQLDFANTFRVGANSKANIATLTNKDIQIQVSQGVFNYVVSKDSEAEPEIDTPNVSVHPAHHDGIFRVEVRPDGDTVIIVRKGEAQIATPQGSAEVHSGEMATVRGDANSAQYKLSDAPERDDWDRWNADRDHLIQNAQSWSHTNRYYTGTQDLDNNGKWEDVPDYGNVWVPNEPEGWAPYRDGNWVYEPYYGWTWVGYEPWGWAPYHYGRWFSYGGGWAWWPGPVYAGYNPFWAPAYVSFWGWGWGVGFGWGGFGWGPIGPCDFFHPWWGGFRGRFGVFGHDRFDRDHFGDRGRFGGIAPLHAGNRFSNINNVRGMSTMGTGHFGTGQGRPMAATREQFSGARMMAGNLPVVPTRASLSASGRAAAPSTIRSGGSEHFFDAVHNTSAHPASFAQETSHLQQSMQQSHVTGFQAGSRSTTQFAAHGNTGASAGGRETGNLGVRGNSSATGMNGSRGTVRSFAPPSGNNTRALGSANSGTNSGNAGVETQRGTSGMNGAAGERGSFRPFTPPAHTESAPGSSGPRGSSGTYWNRTAPSGMESRGYGSGSYGGGRQQLDMRQPIARGPSNGGYRAPSYGGGSRPSYGGGGHVSAPSGGGGRPSGGGGGGHPSGGGGGHAGGGGHH
jgi:hypothetical protein